MKTLQELIAETKASVHCLTPAGAKEMMAEHPEALRIDVREPAEAAEKSVEGFINIPRGVLEMKIGELAKQADHPILLHCATGGRAALASAALEHMGYINVHIVDCDCDELIRQLASTN